PSCLLTIRDDYPELIPGPRTDAVAKNVFLFDEYLAQLLSQNPSALPLKPSQRRYLVHGHCYQKTLSDMGASMGVLAMIPSASAELIDAGCCGMAGAFGYSVDHYDLSLAIANDRLIPALNKAPDAVVIANGTSCRHQIRELTGREPVHLALALAELVNAGK
ncbi:MAG: hypothetical protein GXP42_17915, partial [Chloroflexi bacterium]|nr:hypothetical protein [Chloroflexota bacterium]